MLICRSQVGPKELLMLSKYWYERPVLFGVNWLAVTIVESQSQDRHSNCAKQFWENNWLSLSKIPSVNETILAFYEEFFTLLSSVKGPLPYWQLHMLLVVLMILLIIFSKLVQLLTVIRLYLTHVVDLRLNFLTVLL